jgi:hypothetical protein
MKTLCKSVINLEEESVYGAYKIDPWMVEAIVCDDAQLEKTTASNNYEIEYEDGNTFIISNQGVIGEAAGQSNDLLKAGRYRNTEKFAREHLKIQNEMMRLGALIEAVTIEMNMEDWVADWNNEDQVKYFVHYEHKDSEYHLDYWRTTKTVGIIHMPSEVAKRVCEILNNKEYEL